MFPDKADVRTDRFSYKEFGKFYQCLSVLDLCFSNFIIAPLVIAFWCGTWSIIDFIVTDLHAFTNHNNIIPAIVAIALGFSIPVLFTLFQKQLEAAFEKHATNKFLYFLGSCSHTYLFGCATVSTWHGVWSMIGQLTGETLYAIIAVVIISYIGLVLSRTSCNLRASPFVIATDFNKEKYNFDVPTYFQSLRLQSTYELMLPDIILSILVVGTLISAVWKGTWFLLDWSYGFLSDEKSSTDLLSLEIGYFLALVSYFLQSPVERWVRKRNGWNGLIILDIYILTTFFGAINIWRGVWNTIETCTNLSRSFYVSTLVHLASFLLLVICNASSTLSIRGLFIETVENAEECVEFPLFLRLQLQKKKGKTTGATSENTPDMEHGTDKNDVANNEFKMSGIDGKLESDTKFLPHSEIGSVN